MTLFRAALVALASSLSAIGPISEPAVGNEIASDPVEDCTGKANLYESPKGLKLWATRRGTMLLGENPLRPLTRDTAVILDVVVNGRTATAWGSDFAHLRQGGATRDVEKQGAEPIRWNASGAGFPAEIRVVAEDGTDLLGALRFAGCEDAPATRPVSAARSEPPARNRPPQAMIPGLELRPTLDR